MTQSVIFPIYVVYFSSNTLSEALASAQTGVAKLESDGVSIQGVTVDYKPESDEPAQYSIAVYFASDVVPDGIYSS